MQHGELMDWVQLFSAAGLGAIIATVIQSWWTDRTAIKQRNFQEKKNAYIGFLNAIHRSEIEKTEEASLYAGHWISICEIVGNKKVRIALEEFMSTNPINGEVHQNRPEVMRKLKSAIREDLGFPSY